MMKSTVTSQTKSEVDWSNEGFVFYTQCKYVDAINCFDQALAINANDQNLLTRKGNAFYQLGDYSEAIRCYDKVLSIDSKSPTILNNKGLALFCQNPAGDALNYFEKALAINPNHLGSLEGKAVVYFYQNKLTEAKLVYEQIIQLTKDKSDKAFMADLLCDRGDMYFAIKSFQEARTAFLQALSYNSNYLPAQQKFQKVFVAMKQSPSTNKTDIDVRDSQGLTPLHLAACEGKEAAVKQLLLEGANVNALDNDGWTPLHLAAANGHKAVVELLILHKANIRARDFEGRSPFQRACHYARLGIVELFLDKGVSIEGRDDKSKTPLHAAVSSRTTRDGLKVINFLVKRGANLEAATDIGWTPLHSAVRYSDEETVALLLQLKANTEAKNNFGFTPLLMVCYEEKLDLTYRIAIIKLLLAHKANIEAQDNKKFTALHWACSNGHLPLVTLLVEKGANVNALSDENKTPLHYAAKYGHPHIVKFLASLKKPASAVTSASFFGESSQVPPATMATQSQRPSPTKKPDELLVPPTLQSLQKQIEELQKLVLQQASTIQTMQVDQVRMNEEIKRLKSMSVNPETLLANTNNDSAVTGEVLNVETSATCK
jgi:ankyrin repeat protein/Flp pilus assembly protein TadD